MNMYRHPPIVGKIVPGYPLARAIIEVVGRFVFRLLLKFHITGLENVPQTGPVVTVINHIAAFDPIVAMIAVDTRLIIPMTKIEALDIPVGGWLMKVGGVIPVRRGETDTSAIKMALKILGVGGAVMLAPEGTRSPTKQLQAAKDGAAMLAFRGGATIVPIGVTGADQFSRHWKRLRRAPVKIVIGRPFQLQAPSGSPRPSREEMARMTGQMMYRVAELLPPEFRGVYGDMPPVDPVVIKMAG
jgi:1-acyl-sn-glycerol-3-phosphate acyltransferase